MFTRASHSATNLNLTSAHGHSIYSSATPCRHLWCQWSQQ